MIKNTIKKIVPKSIKNSYNKRLFEKKRQRVLSLPPIDETSFYRILQNDLGITRGDTVFIHSSLDGLNISFQSYNILKILLDIVGEDGTILFPSYPKLTSYNFLKANQIFNIKKTPSYMGILTEFARRYKGAIRSLHPTKSVVAIGKNAKQLTDDHNISPYPYDINSPYYKISHFEGKIVGIGVPTRNLSCIHCAEDILKEKFPVNPYYKKLFYGKCIDYNNNEIIVPTFAHNMAKLNIDIPKFVKSYIPSDICEDIQINGMNFFRADGKKFIDLIVELGKNKKTVYSKLYYKWF